MIYFLGTDKLLVITVKCYCERYGGNCYAGYCFWWNIHCLSKHGLCFSPL